ncbi:MAG: T9SS type A sorting domain-containing protein [Bacteroidales bacterium]|nr:T9SS type A sorting domain-containing protein [Bacteroidales bacterium]
MVKTETLQNNQQEINISKLNAGIYMVEIKSENFSRKQKLVIQR